LLEDIPGVGKTTLAKALAKAIGGDFRRVQFTPDMLPSDVTGSSIYRQNTGEFEFRPGPVFANIVLVDEINRATPKTQSALLEAMEEQQVTTDGETRHLKRPFLVLATQNNLEMTGTFPLPEAQLDRFFARLTLGYPDREAEVNILADHQVSRPLDSVEQVCSPEDLIEAQNIVRRVHIDDSVRRYVVDVVRATRDHPLVMVGGSPRGSLMLGLAAQAHAALEGNNFVRPENVKAVAGIVLGHRIIARGEVSARGMHNEQIIEQILQSVAVPVPMNA
jgi:MoxR-like ATPase